MIKLKSPKEIELMRRAGRITAGARSLAGEMAVVGMKTKEIDGAVHSFIVSKGATPAFLNYGGFPASVCISINEEVIHGIPGNRRLRDGDIVSMDVGAVKDGFIGDCADTFIVGRASEEAVRLVEATRRCFFEALRFARPGFRVSDISSAVQGCAEMSGFSVVREFVGHGVGSKLHEEPSVPNFVDRPRKGPDPRIIRGMTIAIEPMVNAGNYAVAIKKDRWTVITNDGSLSAHYENTVLITDGDPEILTVAEDTRHGT
ncbi:MAG: type I methionyl aminopeptidase [Oscillospiraceae bacterium]|jgi:methionyl aminopeptidase|nr:type I methionyl aminopeptidase [Oscillospiraceae bacterium]